jgi:feruloyl esterase
MTAMLIAAGGADARVPGGLPEHCDVYGILQERTGVDARRYAIRFHLRLPTAWNGRFLFQGGGGTNGEVGDALGAYNPGATPALLQGYAVVSQDSGHDNRLNNDTTHGGTAAFGFDPVARSNYGHASLKLVADAARAAIGKFYGANAQHAYFAGCSKGGEEGMALAERYPEEFDGTIAAAPGFSLPKAAVAQALDVQTFGGLAFSDTDFGTLHSAILAACDADDGVTDGMVADFEHCTTDKVRAALLPALCSAGKTDDCLSNQQFQALRRSLEGPKDSHGRALYSDWPWDAGIGAAGWRAWKLGSADGLMPSRSILLGGPSLASVFTTPPTTVAMDAGALAAFMQAFDFDHDAGRIFARDATFARSAWEEISARSADLNRFRGRHGKLIVPHGVSDPVFSIHDTLAWWREVDQLSHGQAADFVRSFPVPGMNHCGGGPATDRFDALAALVDWVEQGKAPEQIIAMAGAGAPWPGRTRPLCAYPATARYRGGDIERSSSFECRN